MRKYVLGIAGSLWKWDQGYGPKGGNLDFEYYHKLAFGVLVQEYDPSQPISDGVPILPQGSSWNEIQDLLIAESTSSTL